MFCLGCGAEAAQEAERCAVCGLVVPDTTKQDAHAGDDSFTLDLDDHGSSQRATGANLLSLLDTSAPAPGAGLHQRVPLLVQAMLLTLLVMSADLLLPWSRVYGQDRSMAARGEPGLALLLLLGIGALPLINRHLRARPLFAALPLLVGTFCLGVGATYWAVLGRENATAEQAIHFAPSFPGVLLASQTHVASGPQISPAIGLYLFLLGALVLLITGYRVLLAAAQRTTSAARQDASHAHQPRIADGAPLSV